MARRSVWLDSAEQAVLDQVRVRLIEPDEKFRWDDLIATRHYLKNATLVGEQLRYVVERDGQWLALLGWSAAAYHLKGRDGWIGWSNEQRRRRLHLLANNARFLAFLTGTPQARELDGGIALRGQIAVGRESKKAALLGGIIPTDDGCQTRASELSDSRWR